MKAKVDGQEYTLVEGAGANRWEVFGDGPEPLGEVWKDVNWLATGAARSYATRKSAIRFLAEQKGDS